MTSQAKMLVIPSNVPALPGLRTKDRSSSAHSLLGMKESEKKTTTFSPLNT